MQPYAGYDFDVHDDGTVTFGIAYVKVDDIVTMPDALERALGEHRTVWLRGQATRSGTPGAAVDERRPVVVDVCTRHANPVDSSRLRETCSAGAECRCGRGRESAPWDITKDQQRWQLAA
ncbi:hypothetical protein ACFVZD_37350 [Streptomyces sp. NPDC058287]|uniref:hypothetical protein n=2 Tax=unclassified Streptomyces TaxID=2593676 RepID=UPI0036EAA334